MHAETCPCLTCVLSVQPATSSGVISRLCENAEVLQLYRYPGLGASQLHTLLRKVSVQQGLALSAAQHLAPT